MGRTSRFRISSKNASKGHTKLGSVLREIFPMNKIYQEYGYDMILLKGYKTFGVPEEFRDKFLLKRARRLKADWVVLDMMLAFEYQGLHHYEAIDYEKNPDTAESNLQRRIMLDKVKRIICKEANFFLVEIPYWEDLSVSNLSRMIDETMSGGLPYEKK